MAFAGAPRVPLTAAALQALNEVQRAESVDGEFDGRKGLRDGKEDKPEIRFGAGSFQDETLPLSKPLDFDELFTRLRKVADNQDGSLERRFLRSPPAALSESSQSSTQLPLSTLPDQAPAYHELVKRGLHPVCSMEDLANLRRDPTVGCEKILPWLTDLPGSKDAKVDIRRIFQRQFDRWWDFHKAQWDNRGIRDDEEQGFSAFLEADRSVEIGRGHDRQVIGDTYERVMRDMWQQKGNAREFRVPDNQIFPLYRDALKMRLARFKFARPLQLKKNLCQQTEWTNWLEYVGWEQMWLEKRTARAESLEGGNHKAWAKLLKVRPPATPGRHWANFPDYKGNNPGQCWHGKQRETIGMLIDDLIQETARYRKASTAAYFQRLRVEWAVGEARKMETEMSQQPKTAQRSANNGKNGNRKGRRADDGDAEDKTSGSPHKRTRLRHDADDVISISSHGNPRRSKRLANKAREQA